MTKQKIPGSQLLTEKIGVRVSSAFYEKLKAWLASSNCRTVTELARRILYKEEIIWYHKDATFESLLIELTAIRRELRMIGNNVNQVTRHFNASGEDAKRTHHAIGVLEEFKKVISHVDHLRVIILAIEKRGGEIGQRKI